MAPSSSLMEENVPKTGNQARPVEQLHRAITETQCHPQPERARAEEYVRFPKLLGQITTRLLA